MTAMDKFHRDLRLRHFFSNAEETFGNSPSAGFEHKNFRLRSTWQPPRGPPTLEHFIAQNTMKANQLPSLRTKSNNLTKDERDAIKSLSNNRHIIIKPADKGSGTVIMNTRDYIFEAKRQLADTSFYAALDHDPTEPFTQEINTYIIKMFSNSEIGKRCFHYLFNTHTRPGRFYLLPKIHKNVVPPPGRPIISAIGSPTEKISEFIDHFLQPFLADMPSFVKDTGHFLYILSKLGPIPPETILVTLDVTSLYTNVPLLQAKQAVGRVLARTRPGATEPSNQSLIKLLDFVFTRNVFTFSDGNKLHYFVQTNGVSMGSKCAPSVACTYMGEFERQHVYTYHLQPLLWLRYVDDVFCLWNHGDTALLAFVDFLNSRENRINFTCLSSTDSLEFLDTTVHINDGVLNTELFIKPTNSLSYLERTSFHPNHTFTSLPYGEFVRARRNCSTAEAYEIFSQKIKSAFLTRGYDASLLETARLRASSLSRDLLFDAYKADQTSTPPPREDAPFHFINTFHPESYRLRKIIEQNWTILETSDTTSGLHKNKITFGHRRNKRLRDLLVHSQIPLAPLIGKQGKSSPHCDRQQCLYCGCLNKTGTIISHTLQRSFNTKTQVCCQSSNLVYCLQCNICGKQYVGETKRTFHERIREHFRNIRKGLPKEPLGRHFNDADHRNDPSQITAYILAFITAPPNSKDALKMRLKFEFSWMHRLRTSLPMGLNSMD